MVSDLLTIDEDLEDLEDVKYVDEIERILLTMFQVLGMDKPSNYEQIANFVFEDVKETSDYPNFNDSDVTIAFRRWMEEQI